MQGLLTKVGFALVATTALMACRTETAQETKVQEKSIPQVSVRQIQPNQREETLSYSGTIEADNSVSLGFSVPGRVTSVLVNEGQHVAKGKLLATIDPIEYDNALLIANAGLEQAEDMYKRLEELYQKGSLPAKDYIDIKTKLAQAKANKNLSEKRVSDTKLYASISGIISSKGIEVGSTAAPGLPAFTVMKTDLVYARVSVPESEIGKLSVGQNASVFIPTLNQHATGKITIINPQADPTAKTYNVRIRLANANGRLLPGMLAETKINTGQQTASILVPAQSVVRDADNITYVFVANEQKKAVRKRIATSGVSGDEVVVSSGLQTGDNVIVAGQSRLKEGMTVSF